MSVLTNIAGVVNIAGNITNTLTNAAPKSFYSLRDFYNFIRKDENCPMAHSNFFTVVPEIKIEGLVDLWTGSILRYSTKCRKKIME